MQETIFEGQEPVVYTHRLGESSTVEQQHEKNVHYVRGYEKHASDGTHTLKQKGGAVLNISSFKHAAYRYAPKLMVGVRWLKGLIMRRSGWSRGKLSRLAVDTTLLITKCPVTRCSLAVMANKAEHRNTHLAWTHNASPGRTAMLAADQ
jgi:hypothetical protein